MKEINFLFIIVIFTLMESVIGQPVSAQAFTFSYEESRDRYKKIRSGQTDEIGNVQQYGELTKGNGNFPGLQTPYASWYKKFYKTQLHLVNVL